MREQLIEENEMLDRLKADIEDDLKRTHRNIIAMDRAVSASARPGKIHYKQSKPETGEIDKLAAIQTLLNNNRQLVQETKKEIGEFDLRERQRRASSNKITNSDEWFKTYGKPIRHQRKEEMQLSFPFPPVTHIAGASSKDQKINFAFQTSSAFTMRRGNLTR